jgi:hypothetical protein
LRSARQVSDGPVCRLRVAYQANHLHAARVELGLQLGERAEFCCAHRREVSWVAEQYGPFAVKELVEVEVAVGCFCLKVRCCSICSSATSSQSSIYFAPVEPSLKRGCSAGSARPRRSSGAALGCWRRSVGRAAERRAREAARGRKEAILQYMVV